MRCEAQGASKGGDAEEKAPIMAIPQDASQATTRGEAVNDFVRSPQVIVRVEYMACDALLIGVGCCVSTCS